MKTRSLLVSIVVLAVSAGPALAQKVEMIPKDVAEDLMSIFSGMGQMGASGDRMSISIGRVSDDIAGKVYLPPTTKVLASMAGFFATTVLESSLSRDSTISSFQREMHGLGWKPVATQRAPWGFTSAPGPQRDTAFALCSSSASLLVSVRETAVKTVRMVLVSIPDRATECEPQPANRADAARAQFQNRMPTLINPPSIVRPRGNCGGSGGGSSSSGSPISTTLSDDDLLSFYGKQLADSGWAVASPQPAARAWVKSDSSGMRRELVITVRPSPAGDTCRSLDMRMRYYR